MRIYAALYNAAITFLENQTKLPAESIRLIHPLPLRTHNLFNDITSAALAAIEGRNLFGELLNLHCCIGRADGETANLHDLIIGDIIAHVEDFFGREFIH